MRRPDSARGVRALELGSQRAELLCFGGQLVEPRERRRGPASRERGVPERLERLDVTLAILRRVRSHLRDALDLPPGDLDSAIVLVQSQLDLSLSRHLAD